MADEKLSQLSEVSTLSLTDLLYVVDETASPLVSYNVTASRLLGFALRSLAQGRLTLTSGTPITTTDVTGATTVYWTPFRGNFIALYDGTRWELHTFSEITQALGTVTSGLPYDVFVYMGSSPVSPTTELVAWTDGTTRATALALQDGIYVLSGDATKRYVGTIYTTGTTTTEDSLAKRFVWNYYNRVARKMKVNESTASWTLTTTATWRAANASTTNRLQMVIGVDEDMVSAKVMCLGSADAGRQAAVGIALDSTSTTNADWVGYRPDSASGDEKYAITSYKDHVGVGFHFLQWTEYNVTGGATITFISVELSPFTFGINGVVMA